MNSWIWSTVFHSRLVHVTSSFLFDSKPHVVELPTCSSELTETPWRLETFSTHSFHGCLALAKTNTVVQLQNMFLGLAIWAVGASFRLWTDFLLKHPQLRCVDFPFITLHKFCLGDLRAFHLQLFCLQGCAFYWDAGLFFSSCIVGLLFDSSSHQNRWYAGRGSTCHGVSSYHCIYLYSYFVLEPLQVWLWYVAFYLWCGSLEVELEFPI